MPSSNGNNNNGVLSRRDVPRRMPHSSSLSTTSDFTSISQAPRMPRDRISVHSLRGAVIGGGGGAGGGRGLAASAEMSGSMQSFQQAMDNPCEYFVDVM